MDPLKTHPFVPQTVQNKALGVLIGSALGDAIGLYTEFLPSTACRNAYPTSTFTLHPTPTPFREDSHRDKFSPGSWTDDTDQALLIVLSYLQSCQERERLRGKGGLRDDDAGVRVRNGDREEESEVEVKENEKTNIVNAHDIAHRIHSWERQGLRALNRPPLGIGRTIGRVVRDVDYLASPSSTATKIWVKLSRDAAPNGSLMRTHPLGIICMFQTEEEAMQIAADVSRVTHVDPRCVASCCLQVALIRGILRGEVRGEGDVDAAIERVWKWVNSKERQELWDPESGLVSGEREEEDEMGWEKVDDSSTANPDVNANSKPTKEDEKKEKDHPYLKYSEYTTHVQAQTFASLQLDDSQKMGYVYKTLGTAILSLRLAMRREKASLLPLGSQLFENIITELIMQGGDADTNACAAGALLGAWVGYERLPEHWEKGLQGREWLVRKSLGVLVRVGVLGGGEDEEDEERNKWRELVENDPDTAIDAGKGEMSREEMEKMEMDVLEMVLMKQKARRDLLARKEKEGKKRGLGKWFGKEGKE